ncbi:MAG: Ribose ABC transport system, ATP-binding protein RbsA, partial [uncultured Thermomicrobiales bacterium]
GRRCSAAAAPRHRHHQALRRHRRPARGRPRDPARRGPRPDGRERRRQVHPRQDRGRGRAAGRRHPGVGGHPGRLRGNQRRRRRRDRHRPPGTEPDPRPLRRREHLPDPPGGVPRRLVAGPAGDPAAVAGALRAARLGRPGRPRPPGRGADGRRTADGRDRAGALARRPPLRARRADGGAQPARGRGALPAGPPAAPARRLVPPRHPPPGRGLRPRRPDHRLPRRHPLRPLRDRDDDPGRADPGDGWPRSRRPLRDPPPARTGRGRAACARARPGQAGPGRLVRGPPGRDRRRRRSGRRRSVGAGAGRLRCRPGGPRRGRDPWTGRSHRLACRGDRGAGGAGAGGPQGAGAADRPADRPEPDARRPGRERRLLAAPRQGPGDGPPDGRRVADQGARAVATGRLPLRRQPAKGGPRQVAGDRAGGADPGRADPRHRHRHQVRALRPDRRPGGEGDGDPPRLLRAARVAGADRPHPRDAQRHDRRRDPPRAGQRRGDPGGGGRRGGGRAARVGRAGAGPGQRRRSARRAGVPAV